MTNEKIKSAVESILFVWGEAMEARSLAELFNLSTPDMQKILDEMADEYAQKGSGLIIRRMDKSYQLCTNPENDDYIRKLCTPVKEKHLSQAALEVLAIIAYKQPVTKAQIDAIRGIKSDRVIEGLTKKGLIQEKGRSNAIGRPIIYGTTTAFLAQFGFETLEELPELEDIGSIMLDDEDIFVPDEIPDEDQMTIPNTI